MSVVEKGRTLNVRGKLLPLDTPLVMGILNVTPDSFYAASRQQTEDEVARRADQIVAEGADIIDVGGCSTRPGATCASESEERERLRMALDVVGRRHPGAVVSVDTFRPELARMAVEEYGVSMVNDVSEGSDAMYAMVARLKVPYVLTSVRSTLLEMLPVLADEVARLRALGVNDIIVDPGFGFGKTLEQNYALLSQLHLLHALDLPLLVGVSRKSMLWRLLGTTPDDTLSATTALHAVALMKGASVLRVHDVAAAVQVCKVMGQLTDSCQCCS